MHDWPALKVVGGARLAELTDKSKIPGCIQKMPPHLAELVEHSQEGGLAGVVLPNKSREAISDLNDLWIGVLEAPVIFHGYDAALHISGLFPSCHLSDTYVASMLYEGCVATSRSNPRK